jgi:protocatechuate 3,4-dioxygenase beta subunit
MNDLKFAFRQLLKNPGFTVQPSRCRYGGQAVVVLTLALAIGCVAPATNVYSSGALQPTTAGVTNMVSSDEPGDRLVIHGTVFGPDGKTPVTNAIVRVFHTDASGLYSREMNNTKGERNPRLQASLRTGPRGRYEIHTIMPGRYPGGKSPAHVHMLIAPPGGHEHHATFSFAGDPALTAEDYERHGRDGTFSSVRPAERSPDGLLRCQRDIRLRSEERTRRPGLNATNDP